jgi:hypothetical protein
MIELSEKEIGEERRRSFSFLQKRPRESISPSLTPLSLPSISHSTLISDSWILETNNHYIFYPHIKILIT